MHFERTSRAPPPGPGLPSIIPEPRPRGAIPPTPRPRPPVPRGPAAPSPGPPPRRPPPIGHPGTPPGGFRFPGTLRAPRSFAGAPHPVPRTGRTLPTRGEAVVCTSPGGGPMVPGRPPGGSRCRSGPLSAPPSRRSRRWRSPRPPSTAMTPPPGRPRRGQWQPGHQRRGGRRSPPGRRGAASLSPRVKGTGGQGAPCPDGSSQPWTRMPTVIVRQESKGFGHTVPPGLWCIPSVLSVPQSMYCIAQGLLGRVSNG